MFRAQFSALHEQQPNEPIAHGSVLLPYCMVVGAHRALQSEPRIEIPAQPQQEWKDNSDDRDAYPNIYVSREYVAL